MISTVASDQEIVAAMSMMLRDPVALRTRQRYENPCGSAFSKFTKLSRSSGPWRGQDGGHSKLLSHMPAWGTGGHFDPKRAERVCAITQGERVSGARRCSAVIALERALRNLNRRSAPSQSTARISRRDFLDGLLIASGSLAVGQSSPMRAFAAEPAAGACDDMAGDDPRILRGGNLPAAFNVGHWTRDRRLTFNSGAVTIAPGCDAHAGRFEISDEAGEFDVIVVGAGLAGLSSAFYLLQKRPGTRILLLEANSYAGGNAARDEGAPLPVRASTAGAFCALPEAGFMRQLYKEIGLRRKVQNTLSPNRLFL